MNKLTDYHIRFLDAEGNPIGDRSIVAESLAIALDRAVEITLEIGADDFFITSLPPKTED